MNILITLLITLNIFFTFSLKALVVNTNVQERQFIEKNFLNNSLNNSMSAELAFSPLIAQLDKKYMPIQYLRESLPYIRKAQFIKLKPNIYGIYNRLTKKITLGLDFLNLQTGRLKKLKDLTTDQVSTIYHEFWHVYLDNVLSKGRSSLYHFWKTESAQLYSKKGRKIHDEAYALYCEEISKNYLNFYRIFNKGDSARRERLRSNPKLAKIYGTAFNFVINGYYQNWRGIFINSSVNLPLKDRENIEHLLFNNLISRDYQKSFSESKF